MDGEACRSGIKELMKKRHIDETEIIVKGKRPRLFVVTKDKARGVIQLLKDYEVVDEGVTRKEAFRDLHEKYSEAGSILKGERYSTGMTQVELAEKLGVDQADISKMESGIRPVGKAMAKRLAKVFRTDYRVFL